MIKLLPFRNYWRLFLHQGLSQHILSPRTFFGVEQVFFCSVKRKTDVPEKAECVITFQKLRYSNSYFWVTTGFCQPSRRDFNDFCLR